MILWATHRFEVRSVYEVDAKGNTFALENLTVQLEGG